MFHSQGFTNDDNEFLVHSLNKMGLDARISNQRRKRKNVRIPPNSYEQFLGMVSPYIPWKCFQYKIDMTLHARSDRATVIDYIEPQDALDIRRLFQEGWTVDEISRLLRLSRPRIGTILEGKSWSGISEVERTVSYVPSCSPEHGIHSR